MALLQRIARQTKTQRLEDRKNMIEAKKLDGKPIWINPHQIESMELLPDLTLTMLSGKKLIIQDKPADIINRIIEYRSKIDVFKQEV